MCPSLQESISKIVQQWPKDDVSSDSRVCFQTLELSIVVSILHSLCRCPLNFVWKSNEGGRWDEMTTDPVRIREHGSTRLPPHLELRKIVEELATLKMRQVLAYSPGLELALCARP